MIDEHENDLVPSVYTDVEELWDIDDIDSLEELFIRGWLLADEEDDIAG